MRVADLLRLLLLAAIWGGSFVFMRILAPVFGPIVTAELRILIAGAVLTVYFLFQRFSLDWRSNWKHYLVIGVINSAIPFSLYSYAALHIPAS
ncbi:MAG: DMT family transporter [Deltaproteobacteria bacterium]|nr:DMT family transporter [Deltaproteobacteria bacterium]MBI3295321.1 DMT family transporter [Deltaproteobacteria bacterium]